MDENEISLTATNDIEYRVDAECLDEKSNLSKPIDRNDKSRKFTLKVSFLLFKWQSYAECTVSAALCVCVVWVENCNASDLCAYSITAQTRIQIQMAHDTL